MKLIIRLQEEPETGIESGIITLDGVDIAKGDEDWARKYPARVLEEHLESSEFTVEILGG